MLHTKFQASEPSGLEKDFFLYFLRISVLQTQDHLELGHFASWDLHLNRRGNQLMLYTKFEASEPSVSEEEDF